MSGGRARWGQHLRSAAGTVGSTALGLVVGLAIARPILGVGSTDGGELREEFESVRLEAAGSPAVAEGPIGSRAIRFSLDAGAPPSPSIGTGPTDDDARAAEPDITTPEELAAASTAYGDARRQFLNELLARSPRAPDLEATVRADVEPLLGSRPSVRLLGATCSRDLCRIELHHEVHGEGHELLRDGFALPTLRGAGFTTERPDPAGGYVTWGFVGQGEYRPPAPDMATGG